MELNKWLDKKINIENNTYIANKYYSQTDDIKNYYLPNDTEILKGDIVYDNIQNIYDTQIYNDLDGRKNYVSMVNILKNTRRYELDTVFRRLLDYSMKRNIKEQEDSNLLITPELRESFYKFSKLFS